jgi:hypothetical protein
MTFLIVCLLAGLLLGQRFKVLVLIPAAAVVIALSFAGAEVRWPIALMAVAATVSLQMGYLLGLVVHYMLTGVHANSSPASSLAGSTPRRRSAQ